MQCNIDRAGKTLRLSMGLVTGLIGIGFLVGNFLGIVPLASPWFFKAGVAAIFGGGFMMFEGACGWCVVRAMGFKTPI